MLLVAAGALVLLVALHDLFATAIAVERGGAPISTRLRGALWRLALWLHRRRPSHRALTVWGNCSFLLVILLWVGAMWLGWTLIFVAYEDAILDPDTRLPAGLAERIYFTGYTLSTLGSGNLQPQGDAWKITTTVASTTGFFVLTLIITYVLSVLSAAVSMRALALSLASLGASPEDVLIRHWNGRDLSPLAGRLHDLSTSIAQLAQQMLAYPGLHDFHAPERCNAAGLQIAKLDHALAGVQHALRGRVGVDSALLDSSRYVLSTFLAHLRGGFVRSNAEPLPPLDLARLRRAGLPTVDEADYLAAIGTDEELERRRRLGALVESDGWDAAALGDAQ